MSKLNIKPIFLSLLCINFFSTLATAQLDWKEFIIPEQHFSVMVPGGLMKNGMKKVLTDIGTFHPITWAIPGHGGDNNLLYMVSYIDYPEGILHQDSIELVQLLYKESVDGIVADLQGEIVYSNETVFLRVPSLLFRASYHNNKTIVKGRIVIVNNRMYILQVHCPTAKSLNTDMDTFLDSLNLKTITSAP